MTNGPFTAENKVMELTLILKHDTHDAKPSPDNAFPLPLPASTSADSTRGSDLEEMYSPILRSVLALSTTLTATGFPSKRSPVDAPL